MFRSSGFSKVQVVVRLNRESHQKPSSTGIYSGMEHFLSAKMFPGYSKPFVVDDSRQFQGALLAILAQEAAKMGISLGI